MTQETIAECPQLLAQRRDRLPHWQRQGSAYPNDFRRSHNAQVLQQQYADQDRVRLSTKPRVAVCGRIVLQRLMGKAGFITLQDASGRIQIYARRDGLAIDQYDHFQQWDLGDIVGIAGYLFRTHRGELTVHAEKVMLLSKALRPLPDKHKGLLDTEQRYRQRYLDLIANAPTRTLFQKRSRIIAAIRDFFEQRDFLEVETPMMHPLAGGAAARPFTTYYQALEQAMYLRIAPELYLKRLIVGGFERVFEINRNFRNEGLSPRHNPEFTMLEFYQAYADYQDLMTLTETLFTALADQFCDQRQLTWQEKTINLQPPFRRCTLRTAILEYNPQFTAACIDEIAYLRRYAEGLGIIVQTHWGTGKLQLEIFEKSVEAQLIAPTFITEFPLEVSPLARISNDNSAYTDRFELFIGGREIANGFSELNDPEDQQRRFEAQQQLKQTGDDEAMDYDTDYITALEYGMPPTAGEGIGIDRLVMLFTDAASIRDVILFPQLRKVSSSQTGTKAHDTTIEQA